MNRSLQLDSLRGLLLILMTIDHLLLWPFNFWQTFYRYSYGPLGFFTAAECFFFISGILAGNLLKNKPDYISKSLPKRLFKLYFANMLGLSILTMSAFLFPDYFYQWGNGFLDDYFLYNPIKVTILAAFFIYLPSFFNILPLYFYFFASLALLNKIVKNSKYIIFTLFCSIILWILGQFALQNKIENYLKPFFPIVDLGWFDIFSWQILFVLAFILGYHQKNIRPFLLYPHKIIIFLVTIFCISCFFIKHKLFLDLDILWLTDIQTLGIIRLLNFLAAAYLIYLILNKYIIFNIKIFANLGNNSLSVFVYHSCLVYYLGAFTNQIKELNLLSKIIIFIMAILSLYLVLAIKKLAKNLPVLNTKAILD